MKPCPYCGSELADDARFCGECGKSLPEEAPVAAEAPAEAPAEPAAEPVRPEAPAPAPQAPVTEAPVVTQMPPRKQMLSTFQYFALSLLYALPVIGLVFLFIFGAGHPKNGSLKRFSAAMLILRLLFWIALFALLIVAMVKNGRLITDALNTLLPAIETFLKALFA